MQKWVHVRCRLSPAALEGHSACVVANSMIVFGGCTDGIPQNSLWQFDFGQYVWHLLPWFTDANVDVNEEFISELFMESKLQWSVWADDLYWNIYSNHLIVVRLCAEFPAYDSLNKKHLKNVGPIRYCEPPLHCQSPGVASRTPAIVQAVCDVHDIDDDNDNAWQRGLLWPHGMGPMSINAWFSSDL